MKRAHAFQTVATAMMNARQALRPAIVDLASSSASEEHHLERILRMYLTLATEERRAVRFAINAEDGLRLDT